MLDRVANFFTSLKLTVALLCLGTLLVFIGTLAQVDEGLYQAQARYFKSFFIWWSPASGVKLPVFPGGYLLGSLLLVNLFSAHAKRFKFTRKKIGINLTHAGIILLLLGQLITDVLSTESAMRLAEGESKNYSQDFHANELVVIDTSDAQQDEVVAVPEPLVASRKEIRHAKLPVTLRVKNYWPNTDILAKPANGTVPSGATHGVGADAHIRNLPVTAKMDERNLPSAVIEVLKGSESLGAWLVSSQIGQLQTFTNDSKVFQLALRFTRHYKAHSITLQDFAHDKYKGTDIPKNFSSVIRLQNPETREDREVKIWMNNPLRYAGETYYQAGFDDKDPTVTILQVVRNPGWLTPYLACVLVALGLIVQFMTHLIGFAMKRRTA